MGEAPVRARGEPEQGSPHRWRSLAPSSRRPRGWLANGLKKGQRTCDAMQVGAHTVSSQSWTRDHSNPAANKIVLICRPFL